MNQFAENINKWLEVRFAPFLKFWDGQTGNFRGSVYMAFSGIVFATMVTLVKFTGQRLPVIEILFLRQLVVLLVVSPVLVRERMACFKTDRLKLHLARVVFSAIAMTSGFTAVVYLPLAEATSISFARSLFTTVLAVFILHEIVGWRRWGATLVGFIGVLVIVRPAGENFNEYAWLALLSSFFVALIIISLRLLSQTERTSTIMIYQTVFLLLILGPLAAWDWVTPTLPEFGLILAIGLLMSVGQWSNIRAYANGEPSAIAPMEYGRLLFATLFGLFIFSEVPTIYTGIGAILIVGSTLYTVHRNAIKKSPIKPSDES